MQQAIVCPTPIGPLRVLVDDDVAGTTADGTVLPWAVVAAQFGTSAAALADDTSPVGVGQQVADAVAAWTAGAGDALAAIPVAQPGGPFRQRVWQALRAVPAGAVCTYGELAAAAGSPRAMRAAGSAMATNAVAPFVPCHRVVRTGGALGEYAYGVEHKRRLLEHEGALPTA